MSSSARTQHRRRGILGRLFATLFGGFRAGRQRRDRSAVMEVPVEVIGRGNAGKSALFWGVAKDVVSALLPSGLQLDVNNPRALTQLLKEVEMTRKDLKRNALPPTMDTHLIHYILYEGDHPWVRFRTREVIGQVLTETTEDSSDEWQRSYEEYVDRLSRARVLWVVLNCPPRGSSAIERDRFNTDNRRAAAYLREALRLHSGRHCCAVALVLTKLDTLFPTVQDARAKLTDDVLRRSMHQLHAVVSQSDKVSRAAIFPVSAFGFGNAQRTDGADATDEEEAQWILRPGATGTPFNIKSLVTWSLLEGMLPQEVDIPVDGEMGIARVCRYLREDLANLKSWYVPIKGRRPVV